MDPSLAFPAPRAMTSREESDFSVMLTRIYRHCASHRSPRVGRPYMTWHTDLRAHDVRVQTSAQVPAERLTSLTFTPFMDARREVTGSQFEFRFALRSESFFTGDRIEFTGLQTCITGSEFERIFPIPLSETLAEEDWDRYGQGVTAEVARHYETILYPRVLETLGKIAALRGGEPLHVVDLGGGAGRLAELVCEQVPEARTVTVVERSPGLLAEAAARAAKRPERMKIVQADILVDAFWGRLEHPPDVLVLCGVVAQQVIEPADGLHLVQACHRELREGGFALLPSFSPALLSGAAFEGMGFVVHNRTLSFFDAPGGTLRTNDFYILEKKASSPAGPR